MPRFTPDPSTRNRRPAKAASKSKSKAKKKQTAAPRPDSPYKVQPRQSLPKETNAPHQPTHSSKGKQKEVRSDRAHSSSSQHLGARAQVLDAASVPPLFASSFSSSVSAAPSPTATTTAVSNPIADIRHNTPLQICIVIGAVVITATLSVGLAWILRMVCCSSERKARRRRKLDRSTWSPSALASAKADAEKSGERLSFDSVTVTGDDQDLERKDAKIDALFADTTSDGHLGDSMPVLAYTDAVTNKSDAPKSTWNGKGWTLFDPPVESVQPPPPAAVNPTAQAAGGGNYGAARQELADCDVGGFTWPASVNRQPSFIERLVQRHHQASELPTAAPLPYPFQPKPPQPASRMASLGGAANRAVMNMLPVTLRNAATTASRQRATRKRYNDMQPYLDSDFEGTIGGKDRELPMARRLRRTEHRFAVDYTTEEETVSPLDDANLPAGPAADHLRFPRVNALIMPDTSTALRDTNAQRPECTPGLAGVGAAWSRRGSQQSVLVAPFAPVVIKSAAAAQHIPKIIEPNRASMLPFPALEGDRRTRLVGSVGRWLGQVSEAGEIADPYTALSPRPDRKLTKNGSLRSTYTSTTLADSTASNSETQVDATSTEASGRAERLLQRVDADQAEHDRQQRRLLRKARMFTSAADAQPATADADRAVEDQAAAANLSRAPSIRPHFCATTDLKSWLEPSKVSTTHGFKVLEEQDAASSVAADPFASDVEVPRAGARKLNKYASYDPLVSDARVPKAKLRSSGSKQNLRSPVTATARTGVRGASKQKRETLRSINTRIAKKASQEALPSACQSSAGITIVSSVFDEAFAAANARTSAQKAPRRSRQAAEEAKARAKAEADVAMRDAWRRRRMLSISSRGSQRTRSTLRTTEQGGAALSRQESMLSAPSMYSELTAPSDYQFQAPLLSAAGGDAALAVCDAKPDAEKAPKKAAKKEAKKEAKREQKRAERQLARAAAAEAEARALAQRMSVRRTIRKQRSASLGAVRTQMALESAAADAHVPDSPWTSSDSDISVRRWGEARGDDAVRVPSTASTAARRRRAVPQPRATSHYYGMRSDELRDLC